MKSLSSTEAELKKSLAYKEKRVVGNIKEKRKILKNCSILTKLFRRLNKHVSTKSFFLDLTMEDQTLFWLDFLN